MSRLVIALPKGRILDEARQLLTAAGLPLPEDLRTVPPVDGDSAGPGR